MNSPIVTFGVGALIFHWWSSFVEAEPEHFEGVGLCVPQPYVSAERVHLRPAGAGYVSEWLPLRALNVLGLPLVGRLLGLSRNLEEALALRLQPPMS